MCFQVTYIYSILAYIYIYCNVEIESVYTQFDLDWPYLNSIHLAYHAMFACSVQP